MGRKLNTTECTQNFKFSTERKKEKKKENEKEEKASITRTNPQETKPRELWIPINLSMNDKHKEDEPIDRTRQSKHKRNNFKTNIETESWPLKQKKKRKLFGDKGKSLNDRRIKARETNIYLEI